MAVTELRGLAAIVLGLVALVVRYRRGTDIARRRLLWLMLAVLIALGATVPVGRGRGHARSTVLFSHRPDTGGGDRRDRPSPLLDIRLVVSRALSWVLLSLAVLVAYVALVTVLDRLVAAQLGRSAVVTVFLVLVAARLPRLQRVVDRAMYGERGDPASVVSGWAAAGHCGRRLGQVLPRFGPRCGCRTRPWTRRHRAGRRRRAARAVDRWPLTYDGESVGALVLGLRPGERALSAADRKALQVLAAPMAVALQATVMAAELKSSREHIVTAQAEERRRLRRQLHDGLGPTLTGIAFTADAAANLIETDPAQSNQLLTALRRDSRAALADVRRIVDDLRPPALDELGLVGALRQRADQLAWRADGGAVRVASTSRRRCRFCPRRSRWRRTGSPPRH